VKRNALCSLSDSFESLTVAVLKLRDERDSLRAANAALTAERDQAIQRAEIAGMVQKLGSPDDPTGVKRGAERNRLAAAESEVATLTAEREAYERAQYEHDMAQAQEDESRAGEQPDEGERDAR